MKDGEIPTLVPQRNPITYGAHKRQITWQIFVPLGLFVLLIIALAIMVLLASASVKSVLADISIIYMAILLMFSALLIFALTITTIYLLYQGLIIIPYKTLQVQAIFFRVERKTRSVLNLSTEPFLRLGSLAASMKAFFRSLK